MFKNLNFTLLIHLAIITWISLCSISMVRLKSQLNDVLYCDEISAETLCKIDEPAQNIEAPLQQATTNPNAIGGITNNTLTSTLPNTIEEKNTEKNISSQIPLDMKIRVPLRDHPDRFREKEIMSTQIFSWTALLAVGNLTMVVYQVYEYYYSLPKVVKPLALDATESIIALKRHNQALQIELQKLTSDNIIVSENLQLITNHNRFLLQRIKKYKKICKASSNQQNENIKRTLFYLEQVYAMLNSQFNQKNVKPSATVLRSSGSLRTIVQMSRRIQSVRSAAILKRICAELLAPIRSRYTNVYATNVLLRDEMRRIQAKSRGKSTTALGFPKSGGTKDTLKKSATAMSVRNAKSTMIFGSSENYILKSQMNRRCPRIQFENPQTKIITADQIEDKMSSPISINDSNC